MDLNIIIKGSEGFTRIRLPSSSSIVSSFPSITLEVIISFMRVGLLMMLIMGFWLFRCREDWKGLLWSYIGAIILAVAVIGGYLW